MNKAALNELTRLVIALAIRVHSRLGPGLLESTYRVCLAHELRKAGVHIISEWGLPVVYDDVRINVGYRVDLLVADSVIVEIKAVEQILPVHKAQLLSYLRLSGKRVGLLLNFNVVKLIEGLTRVVNNF